MNRSGSVASAAIDFRNDLLGRNWPNDSEVVRFSRFSGSLDAAECIARAREARILLGVWSAARRAFVYPDFQFDRRGDLRPEVAELLTLLPKENDDAGWRSAFWLYSPHANLGGQTPAEVFESDPSRVLSVALDEFYGDPDTAW
ncbi:hypothetical protein [Paraburkholderia graminis]|jgi:hypothetical protein|uniref:hypothetical protein n=1 Tax=Paraburkholderia graminis TaxID=60548 RepID=UPI0005C4D960|nr:hypothetical protein [Paraburkholderia graminis]